MYNITYIIIAKKKKKKSPWWAVAENDLLGAFMVFQSYLKFFNASFLPCLRSQAYLFIYDSKASNFRNPNSTNQNPKNPRNLETPIQLYQLNFGTIIQRFNSVIFVVDLNYLYLVDGHG